MANLPQILTDESATITLASVVKAATALLASPVVLFGGAMLGIGVAFADTMDPGRMVEVQTQLGNGAVQLGDVTLPSAMVVLGWLLGKWKPSISVEVVHKADDGLLLALKSHRKEETEKA